MKFGTFDDLYKSLTLDPANGTNFAKKPTDVEIEAFERQQGFRLHESYKQYIRVFGPGEIFHHLMVSSPGCPELGCEWDLALCHNSLGPTGMTAPART